MHVLFKHEVGDEVRHNGFTPSLPCMHIHVLFKHEIGNEIRPTKPMYLLFSGCAYPGPTDRPTLKQGTEERSPREAGFHSLFASTFQHQQHVIGIDLLLLLLPQSVTRQANTQTKHAL